MMDDLIHIVETAPCFCEDLLQSMLERGQTYPPALPDTIAFTTAMKAWAILGKMQQQQQHLAHDDEDPAAQGAAAVQGALQLLTKMQQLYRERIIDAQPNTITYNTLLEVLTLAGQVERAEEILRHEMMIMSQELQHFTAAAAAALPDTVSFRIVIYGWAASYHHHHNRHRPPHLSPSLLPHQRESDQQRQVVVTNNNNKVDWFDRAYRLLQEMQNWQQRQEEEHEGHSSLQGSGMMKMDSSSSSSNNNNNTNHAKVQVDASFYSRLISSLAKDGQYQRAENLYLEMQERFGSSHDMAVVETKNMESIASTSMPQHHYNQQEQQQANGSLLQLQDDCRAKRSMIVVYAKTKRPRQAEQLLKELEQQIEEHQQQKGQWPQLSAAVFCDLAPKASHYRDVIDSWATTTTRNSINMSSKASTSRRQQQQQQSDSVVVDDDNENDQEGLDRGEQLLLRMMDKSVFSGRPDFTPSVHLIDRVLCNWIDKRRNSGGDNNSSSEGCYRAESLLRLLEERLAALVAGGAGRGQQEQLVPLVSVLQEGRPLFFERVIYAWSQCSLFEAPERAESLLWEMQQHCNDENNEAMRPTRFHYCSVVTAWGQQSGRRSDAAESAKEIFAVALDQSHMGHQVARPDTVLYLAVIHACARAGDAHGVKQYTQQLLDDCERQGGNDKNSLVHTTTMTFNTILLSILRCCSSSKVVAQRDILSRPEMALHFFETMNQLLQVQPNARSFQLLAEILSSEKETYATQIEACLDQARRLASKKDVTSNQQQEPQKVLKHERERERSYDGGV